MRRLLGVELTRLRWRRAVLVLMAACVLIPVVIFAVTAWTTRPVSDADLQQAQQQVQRQLDDPRFQRQLERCEQRPERYGVADAAECEQMMSPQVDWFLDRPQLQLQQIPSEQGMAVIIFVTGLLMLAATTFVGADWNSGSMSNQLLFEPRRTRIWLAKAGVLTVAAAVALAAILAGFWAGLWLLAAARGIDPPPGVLDRAVATGGRGVALAAAAVLGAYAVTMLFRSTVFTLGALFAVVIGSTIVLSALGFSQQWMPHLNVAAVIFDGAQYYREPPFVCFESPRPPEGVDCRQYARVELGQAAAYLGSALGLAVAVSLAAFNRRDVP